MIEEDDDDLNLPVEDDEDTLEVEETEDGGAILHLEENTADQKEKAAHFANIVDEVDQGDLSDFVADILEKLERDKEARAKRDKVYEEGLRRTGMGDDAPGGAQFTGATRVVHPMLIEACVDFSARVMKEIFPPAGPVKSKVLGVTDKPKLDRAARKAEFMNWQVTEQIPEFRGELEQLTTQVPLGGAQFLKQSFNGRKRRAVPEFIPIDDILIPFAATDFYSAERKTHVQYLTKSTYAARVRSGMYVDVDLGYASDIERTKSGVANDKIEGRTETSYNEDGLRTVFEVYTHLDFEGEPDPYILTIDKSSGKALSLYRNWDLGDESRTELDWIVEFPFVPWRGAYPIGLTHMIGGLTGAATGSLRALLDSAHIQNIPTLLKLKGGVGGQTLNLQPTQVTEMEGGAMVDDIRKIAMPLPFGGPSPTLFQLLGFLVDAGKGVVQTSFEKLADQNPNAPVGTTLALIEQGMVVFSSIHSRTHNAMARVFKILHRINSANLTVEDARLIKEQSGIDIDPADFDGPMDIVPVSDPAIFSEAQRFAQVQALQQRAALLPGMYDARKVEEIFLRNLKIRAEDVLQKMPTDEDMDPVSENVAAAMGRPVYVLPRQDHMAHLKAHLAFLKSPLFGQNPAIMKTYLFPMSSHLRDHLLNYYMAEAHEAVDKAQDQHLIEREAGEQVQVVLQVQQYIEQQLGGFAQELAQIDQAAQQFKPQPQMPPDNTIQATQMKIAADAQKTQQQLQLAQSENQQRAQLEAAKLADAEKDRAAQAQLQQSREFAETQRSQQEMAVRERMNQQDNTTAMQLALAEIESGERVAVSTGTGINPGA